MQDRALYSIQDARKLLGGISRNTIYQLLRSRRLASVIIGCRRFVSAGAIADLAERPASATSLGGICNQGTTVGSCILGRRLPRWQTVART